jgi:molybdopterin-containing oxidoreductase family membrane subunit
MNPKLHIMGLFTDEKKAASAIEGLKDTPYTLERVHGPIPSHAISNVLRHGKSRVGYFTLAGGIIGFFAGFALAAFTATRWSLIVSGKPVVALVPFFIVGFEFTVLFAVFGNVLGLLTQMRLPRLRGVQEHYDTRCSGKHFGVLAACEAGQKEGLIAFFTNSGGEARGFDG